MVVINKNLVVPASNNEDFVLIHQIYKGEKSSLDVYNKYMPMIKNFAKKTEIWSKNFISAEDFISEAYFSVDKVVNYATLEKAFEHTFSYYLFIRHALIALYRKFYRQSKKISIKDFGEDYSLEEAVEGDYKNFNEGSSFEGFEDKLEAFKLTLNEKELQVFELMQKGVSLNMMKSHNNMAYSTANRWATFTKIKFAKFFGIELDPNYLSRKGALIN